MPHVTARRRRRPRSTTPITRDRRYPACMTTLSFEVPDDLAARIERASGGNPAAWLAILAERALQPREDGFDPAEVQAMLAGAEERRREPARPDTREELQAFIDSAQAELHAA
jgi:hypothetical protein